MLSYELTLDDYIAFHLHMMKKLKNYRSTLFLYQYGFSFIFLAALLFFTRGETYDGLYAVRVAVPFVIFAVISYFGGPKLLEFMIRKNVRAAYKRGKITSRGPFTVHYDQKGLTYNTGIASGTYKWKNVENIEIADDYVFLFISGIEAITIPRRAFPDDAAFQEFVHDCSRLPKRK